MIIKLSNKGRYLHEKELNQIASEYEVAPNMLRNWKKEFLANVSNTFSNKIGQLTIDVNWFKKNLTKLLDMTVRKELVTKGDSDRSISMISPISQWAEASCILLQLLISILVT